MGRWKNVKQTITFLLWSQKFKTIAASILVTGVHHSPKLKHTWGRVAVAAIPVQWRGCEKRSAVHQGKPHISSTAWRSPVSRILVCSSELTFLVPSPTAAASYLSA